MTNNIFFTNSNDNFYFVLQFLTFFFQQSMSLFLNVNYDEFSNTGRDDYL